MNKAGEMANSTMEGANKVVNEAKDNFMRMLKNKNKWGVLFLVLVIIFLVWILSLYIRGKLRLKESNNKRMVNDYSSLGGTKIGGITPSNSNHKFLLLLSHESPSKIGMILSSSAVKEGLETFFR